MEEKKKDRKLYEHDDDDDDTKANSGLASPVFGVKTMYISTGGVHNHNNNHNTRIENNSVNLIKVMGGKSVAHGERRGRKRRRRRRAIEMTM